MKAKCAYCEDGCAKCDAGYIEVSFLAEGSHYHHMICNVCGCATGGHLHMNGQAMSDKPHPYAACPECGNLDLRYSTCEESLS